MDQQSNTISARVSSRISEHEETPHINQRGMDQLPKFVRMSMANSQHENEPVSRQSHEPKLSNLSITPRSTISRAAEIDRGYDRNTVVQQTPNDEECKINDVAAQNAQKIVVLRDYSEDEDDDLYMNGDDYRLSDVGHQYKTTATMDTVAPKISMGEADDYDTPKSEGLGRKFSEGIHKMSVVQAGMTPLDLLPQDSDGYTITETR